MTKGYVISSFHTGLMLASKDLNVLFSQLKEMKKDETETGFYQFLVVNVVDGQFLTTCPIEKFEVKTVEELKEIMIQVNASKEEKEMIIEADQKVKELVNKKIRSLEKYFKHVEKLNRNTFKCTEHSREVRKVRVDDNFFMTIDGKPHSYIK